MIAFRSGIIAAAGSMLAAILLFAPPAMADGWPTSVAGTWTIDLNGEVDTLVVHQPPSGFRCRAIKGTVKSYPLQGFYCPFSGKIVFHVTGGDFGFQNQFYTGQLSQATASPLIMAGSFSDTDPAAGPNIFGDFAFYATK